MRDQLGGIGLGSRILYNETRKGKGNVSLGSSGQPADPGHGTARRAAGVGHRRSHRRARSGPAPTAPTSTQANGFFGTNLKYCGYDAIVIQGQSKDWVYLYIDDDARRAARRRPYLGKDTWETQDALSDDTACAATSSPSTRSARPARTSRASPPSRATTATSRPRTACGAVMGKKKLKAVAIVKGTKALRAARPARPHAGRRRHRARSADRSLGALALRVRHAARRREPLQARRAADPQLHDQRRPTPT